MKKDLPKIYFAFPDKVYSYNCAACGGYCCKGHSFDIPMRKFPAYVSMYPSVKYLAYRATNSYSIFNNPPFYLDQDGLCTIHKKFGFRQKGFTCQLFPFSSLSYYKTILIVSPHLLCKTPTASLNNPKGAISDELKPNIVSAYRAKYIERRFKKPKKPSEDKISAQGFLTLENKIKASLNKDMDLETFALLQLEEGISLLKKEHVHDLENLDIKVEKEVLYTVRKDISRFLELDINSKRDEKLEMYLKCLTPHLRVITQQSLHYTYDEKLIILPIIELSFYDLLRMINQDYKLETKIIYSLYQHFVPIFSVLSNFMDTPWLRKKNYKKVNAILKKCPDGVVSRYLNRFIRILQGNRKHEKPLGTIINALVGRYDIPTKMTFLKSVSQFWNLITIEYSKRRLK